MKFHGKNQDGIKQVFEEHEIEAVAFCSKCPVKYAFFARMGKYVTISDVVYNYLVAKTKMVYGIDICMHGGE